MIRFEWKDTSKQLPPEPAQTKDFWKNVDPGMTTLEVLDWYSTAFEIYACKMKGETGPVPTNLYYIGSGVWMSEQGHVYQRGAVTYWDSYQDDRPVRADYPYCSATVSVNDDDVRANTRGNAAGMTLGALAFVEALAQKLEKTFDKTLDLLRYLRDDFDMEDVSNDH